MYSPKPLMVIAVADGPDCGDIVIVGTKVKEALTLAPLVLPVAQILQEDWLNCADVGMVKVALNMPLLFVFAVTIGAF